MFGSKEASEDKLKKMVEKGKWDKLRKQYLDSDKTTQVALAKACAASRNDGSVNILTSLLEVDDVDVKIAAVTSLGEVGDDATVINDDKKAVAQAITDEACKEAGFDDMKAAADAGTAFVFMGHGTSHTANVTYDQMQTQMDDLGFTNAFIGTVEGEPEDTACDKVIEKVKEAGFKNVILRPLMVVAGDHANNDMAGDDADSWKSQFEASGDFDSVDCQIAGLGRIAAVEDLYVAHTKAAIDSLGASDDAATEDTDAEAADDSADDAQADDAAETTADTAETDAE